MSPAEKSACVDALNREVFLRLAALRNGRDLSIAAYGWDPDIEGW